MKKSKYAFLTAISLFVMVVGGELLLRGYQRAAYGTPFTSLIPSLRANQFVRSPFLVFGPRIDWQIPGKAYPELAYFNQQGLRTTKVVGRKAAGEYRIVALGGSTTENVWNDAGLHWPLVAECVLRERGVEHVEILNAGMSAYSSAHSIVQFQFDSVELEPDMVLFLHNINDLAVTYYAAAYGGALDPNYNVRFGRGSYTGVLTEDDVVLSRFFRLLRDRVWSSGRGTPHPTPIDPDIDEGLRLFERNLRTMHAVTQAHDTQLILLTMPASSDSTHHASVVRGAWNRPGVGPLPSWSDFSTHFEAYNQLLRDFAARYGVPLIDLARVLAPDSAHFSDPIHFTTEGVIAVGTIIGEFLAPMLAGGGAVAFASTSSQPAGTCAWRAAHVHTLE